MLDESKSPKDCTIAILNIHEKYEDLAKSLEDICHEMRQAIWTQSENIKDRIIYGRRYEISVIHLWL